MNTWANNLFDLVDISEFGEKTNSVAKALIV